MPGIQDVLAQAAAHAAAGRFPQARELLRRAAQREPQNAAVAHRLGALLIQTGELDQAIFHLERAARLAPTSAGVRVDLGRALTRQRGSSAARAVFEQALAADPASHTAMISLGQCLLNLDELDEAQALLERAVAAKPNNADGRMILARLFTARLRRDLAAEQYRAAIDANPDRVDLRSNYASMMNYMDAVTASEIFEAHADFGRAVARAYPKPDSAFHVTREPDRPLRVGYFSPDLRDHSVAHFLEPLLEHHSGAIVAHAYASGSAFDAVSSRLKSRCAVWRVVAGLTEAQFVRVVRDDRVDILIDLAGHTSSHRLSVMHLRPAPVQGTFIGYPATTGLAAIDFRFVDSTTDPDGADAFAVERLIRLDPCFLCYRPPVDAPEVSPPPALSRGHITFGSFNASTKITPGTASLWSRIVGSVPGARLVIKSHALDNDAARARLAEMLDHAGLVRDRIEFLGPVELKRDHLAQYARIDIALDTTPYNGTTTTCEALWMGVPVIATVGERHAARVSASLLRAAGLADLIAASPDHAASIARRLAGGLPALAARRATLREHVRGSPLCDGPAFAWRVESAYRELWRGWAMK